MSTTRGEWHNMQTPTQFVETEQKCTHFIAQYKNNSLQYNVLRLLKSIENESVFKNRVLFQYRE